MASVFQVTIEGKKLFLFDLPIEECDAIGQRHSVGWLTIIDRPLQSAGVAKDIVTAAAKKLGVAVPTLPSVRVIYDMFDLVEDDLPSVYEGGIPNALSALATTGSSGA